MDPKALWELLTNPAVIKFLLRGKAPTPWMYTVLQPLLVALLLIAVIGFVWKNLSEPVRALSEWIRKRRATDAEREHVRVRQQFAGYLGDTLRRIDEETLWNDKRFTELEAEYYTGARVCGPWWRRLTMTATSGPYRRRNLTRALATGCDQFALLEGDPGSGKSVLLRRIASEMCVKATTSWHEQQPIALYFNLKMLDRLESEAIDQSLIRRFVTTQLKRGKNDELNRFVDNEFDRGVAQGRWVFLFDSFDEIPEVLGAEDMSDIIESYAMAIVEFATTFNKCRTILATRRFRRPRQSALPKYRILPLPDRLRDVLIARAGLTPVARQRLYDGISAAELGMRYIIENPMYLGLLIEYVRAGDRAPSNAHQLFARFIENRFRDNAAVLAREYACTPAELNDFAAVVAFAIVANSALGLNPRRAALLSAVGAMPPAAAGRNLWLDALEHLQLARGDVDDEDPEKARFTFSHRRFQEYFATALVLRDAGAVTEEALLFDARWRETAAVVLNTNAGDRVDAMVAAIRVALRTSIAALEQRGMCLPPAPTSDEPTEAEPNFFPWPPHCLQLLSLLQDGFAEDPTRLPDDARVEIATIIRSACAFGRLADRRLALEVAGTVRNDDLLPLLRSAVGYGSQLLDDITFRQVRRLNHVPDDLSRWIRVVMFQRAGGQLRRERRSVLAFLARVRDDGRLLRTVHLMSRLGQIDAALHVAFAVFGLMYPGFSAGDRAVVVVGVGASWSLRPTCLMLMRRSVSNTNPNAIRASRLRQRAGWLPRPILTMEGLATTLAYMCAVFLVAFIRLMPAVFTLIDGDPVTAPMLAWVVMASWAPMATAAALAGELTAVGWWPWLSFYPGLALLSHPATTIRRLFHHLRRFWLLYAILAVLGVGFGLLSRTTVPIVGDHSGSLAVALGVAEVAILLLLAGRWLTDWMRLRSVRRSEAAIAAADFAATLDSYWFNSFKVKFIRLVSGRAALPATDASIEALSNLTLDLERQLFRGAAPKQVDAWRRMVDIRTPVPLAWWNAAVLDELQRLEDRLTELRRSR